MNHTSRIPPKQRRLTREDAVGFLFMTPLFLSIVVFAVYPMVDTFIKSFYQTTGITPGVFVGLDNYVNCFNNPDFHQAAGNTFYIGALSILIGIPGSFILASLLNNVVYGKAFFRSIYFLPNIMSLVATAMIFKYIFHPNNEGIANFILSWFGIGPYGWFTDPKMAGFGVVLMSAWKIGYTAIIFLAGLQSIPRELYEAASIDGAGELRKWWSITIPSMRSIFVFMIILLTITQMRRFSDVYVIGTPTGNPAGVLMTIVLYIYRAAFKGWQVGYASAVAYVLFAITLVLTLINLKLTEQRD